MTEKELFIEQLAEHIHGMRYVDVLDSSRRNDISLRMAISSHTPFEELKDEEKARFRAIAKRTLNTVLEIWWEFPDEIDKVLEDRCTPRDVINTIHFIKRWSPQKVSFDSQGRPFAITTKGADGKPVARKADFLKHPGRHQK